MNRLYKRKIICGLLLIFLSLLLLVSPAGADNGKGDGSGGGQDNPLSLVESKPAPGDESVAVDGEIWLLFNKNVVNMTVADNNRSCFSLVDSQGNKIPINVNLPDDQINPELKRQIFIQPLSSLAADMAYILTISPQLQAKNGTSLGVEGKISFTTAPGATQNLEEEELSVPPKKIEPSEATVKTEISNPPALLADSAGAKTAEPSESFPAGEAIGAEGALEPETAEAPEVIPSTGETKQEKMETQPSAADNSQNPSYPMILAVVIILVLGAGYLILRKRK